MAGRKLPILPSNPTPADDDLLYGVDVSDTSESAAGTSKQSAFVNIYTYILGKLSAALRLIPSGGTTGQVLAKSSNTDYEVAWTTAGGGGGAVTADAPILGDGTGGDHLRLDFDAAPTDGSSKLVNSNGVYDFAMTVINITNAALNTACSGGTVNPRAMYRVTNAVGGIVRVWGKSATQVSCAGFQEGSSDSSTYFEGFWGNYDLGVDIFTPVIINTSNTFQGISAGANNTGSDVVQIGNNAGISNAGSIVVQIGVNIGNNLGNGVIQIGEYAGASNIGDSCIQIGQNAGISNEGANCVQIGIHAGAVNTGVNCVQIGQEAGYGNSKDNGVFIGFQAGYDGSNGYTGSDNVFAISNDSIATFADATAAATAITTGNGYVTGSTYIYKNTATGSIGFISL